MKRSGMVLALAVAALCATHDVRAQFTSVWLDIGDFQNAYVGSGARGEDGVTSAPAGWRYPGYIRAGGNVNSHSRGEAFWVGVKDWTDQNGQDWPYYVARIGPRRSGADVAFPLENKLISKWEDSEVTVDGVLSFERVALVHEVDPELPADRVAESTWNIGVGITAKRRAYAYSNDYQDNYQIVEYFFTNTGNADDDEELELEGQTLNDVYFFWINRVRGIRQAADQGDDGQIWGKYNMVDVVGDGHAEYPVDFTAIYTWHGDEPSFGGGYSLLGSPLWSFGRGSIAEDDTLGRLSGGHMAGEVILYAPNSATDPTYDPLVQPRTLSVMDQDEALTSDGSAERDYYELGILARPENRDENDPTNSRMWPHYADRIEPNGEFWNQRGDPASGKQGGYAPLTAYGPYDIGPGETIHIVTAQGVNGLTFDAQFAIGRTYKLAKGDDDLIIEYDADGSGTIDCRAPLTAEIYATTYDYGSECLTKNQWVMTARDSLFKSFYQARDVWTASNQMSQYPSQNMMPPRPPLTFSVFGRPDQIELAWEPMTGGPARQGWEVYRTSRYADNMPYDCVRGMAPDCLGPMLSADETSFNDTEASGVVRGTDYYYYLVAVGEDQPHDPSALNGTPGGAPLRSSRYFTQTWQPTNLKRPSGSLDAARVVPNPINFTSSGGDNGIRFGREDEIAFFNIPGECTIKIYSEVGELIHTIEHTNGSGDEKWDLTTASRQLLTSGIYIAVFETPEGERAFQKFTVIR